MKIVPSYLIQNLQLNDIVNKVSLPFDHESGYYLLFWWNEVPLGHLFLEANQQHSTNELRSEIIKSIEPAVDFYISKLKSVQGNYKDAFLKKNGSLFSTIMEEIFSPYQINSFPNKVPVTVIICTRNRSMDLQRCLHSLKAQKSSPEEIIVVDNAPDDESTFKIVEQHNNAIYILEKRPGLSIARNTGIKKATSPIIAWIDDDVVVHPDWLFRMWEVFSEMNVVASTGLVIASELCTESQQIFEKYWSFNRGYIEHIYDSKYFEKHLLYGPPVWEIGAGANMAFRKSIFDEVGYFDERLGAGASGCSEDSEMWFRILAKGYVVHYTPRAIVYHQHRKELSSLHKQLFYYMRGFTAASLFQQSSNKKADYHKRLLRLLPRHYYGLFRAGFPKYKFRHRTLLSELSGIVSGILFFQKHKNKSS